MKARFQRALALLLVLVLTLGCIPAVSAVQPDEPVTNPEPAEEAAQLPEGSDLGAILQGSKDAELEALQPETPKDTDLVRVIVELDAPALTEQSGMFAGKALTDAGRTAQQNAIAAQEQVEAKIAEAAPEASVRYSYSLLLNGIALECAYGHIAELEALPGVKAVHLVQTYELPTEPKVTSGGGMIGAPTAWNLGMDGSGMVVAVLDTGLDTDHAAFAVDPKSPAVVRGDIDEILSADTLQAQRLVRDLSSSSVYLCRKVKTMGFLMRCALSSFSFLCNEEIFSISSNLIIQLFFLPSAVKVAFTSAVPFKLTYQSKVVSEVGVTI